MSKNDKPFILSFDPGKLNFAYSMMKYDGTLLFTGMLPNNVTDLKDSKRFSQEVSGFKQEVRGLASGKKLRVVFERFVPRGSLYTGNLVEITCLKIGLLLATIQENNSVRITPVLASSWKNAFKRNKISITNDSSPPHILDAICIGLYYLWHKESISLDRLQYLTKSHECVNFNWYCYKNEWYHGERLEEHKRGKRNSFGN